MTDENKEPLKYGLLMVAVYFGTPLLGLAVGLLLYRAWKFALILAAVWLLYCISNFIKR